MSDRQRPNLDDVSTVIFDVDGTLIDSNDAHAETWTQALRAHDVEVDVAQVRRLVGMGGDKLLPSIAHVEEDSPLGRAIATRKKRLFADRLGKLTPCRGARELLMYLRDLKMRLVVATSASDKEMDALLEQAGVADLIPRRTSKDDADRSKPDPDIVRAALARVGASAAESVMIGDTPYDIESAGAAGVQTVALRCGGYWSDADLKGASAIVDDPAALLDRWRRLSI